MNILVPYEYKNSYINGHAYLYTQRYISGGKGELGG